MRPESSMACLPLANILHHKLRSLLSALGIGIGVCMLVTLSGLSRGSLYEIAQRWEVVNADLIVYPRAWGENVTTMSGLGLSDRFADTLPVEHPDLLQKVVPVFLWPLRLAGQDHTAGGVDAADLPTLTGGKGFLEGRAFAPKTDWDTFFDNLYDIATRNLTADEKENFALDITDAQLAAGGWLELVIDSRLAGAGGYAVGDTVQAANHSWIIVGIVPAGAMSRVFLPRKTAQYLFGSGDTTKSTLLFAKLRAGVNHDDAARRLRSPALQAIQIKQYRAMLEEKFGILFVYVDAVNGIALVIAFLFVMNTLYTMVLERTREIAILKSCGASSAFILRQIVIESAILTAGGATLGVAMSFLAAWGIQTIRPLLTVEISWTWIALAAAAATGGAMLAALYPAWRATRVDMVEALSYE
jgi:putative ABC transport system permease protein